VNQKINSGEEGTRVNLLLLVFSIGSGFFISFSDITATFLLIESIKLDLILLQEQVQWITLTYLVIFISFIIFSGDLGDNYGHKLIFQIGIAIVVLGSLLCYFSNSIIFLILSRVIVSIGVSFILPTGIGILTHYTSKEKRSISYGAIYSIIGLAIITGAALALVIPFHIDWNYYYLVNVPIGILCFSFVHFFIPKFAGFSYEKRIRTAWWADIIFALSLAMFFFCLGLFIDLETNQGAIWPGILFIISSFFVLYFAFTRRTRLVPIIGRGLTRNKKISTGVVTVAVSVFGFMGLMVTIPEYLLQILEVGTFIQVGKIMLGLPIGMIFSALTVGKLASENRRNILNLVSLSGLSITLLVASFTIKIGSSIWVPVLISLFTGILTGSFLPTANVSVMKGAVREKFGVVSSLFFISMVFGMTLSSIFSSFITLFTNIIMENRTGIGLENPQNLVISLQTHYIIFGIIILLGALYLYFRSKEKR
jgi:MFS family permease